MTLYIINLIMAMAIFVFGVISWRKTEAQAFLLVGIGFLCFGISHIFKIWSPDFLVAGSPMDWTLIVVRIIGYLLCLWAVVSAK